MHKDLFEEFRRLEGQPCRIFTDDERIVSGIVLCSGDNSVRILKKCGDVFMVQFCHIDTVEEPMMSLHCRCHRRNGRCEVEGECEDFEEFAEFDEECGCNECCEHRHHRHKG